jgi:hypothetical protein
MRYKALVYIHADEDMGWSAKGIEEEIREALDYGDVSTFCFVVEEPEGCDVSPVSSRVCERGTRSCEAAHCCTDPKCQVG